MDVGKLLERIIAQNEIIIRQNEKLLLLLAARANKQRCGTARRTEENQSPRLTRDQRTSPP
jgi:hypothetical protein